MPAEGLRLRGSGMEPQCVTVQQAADLRIDEESLVFGGFPLYVATSFEPGAPSVRNDRSLSRYALSAENYLSVFHSICVSLFIHLPV